MKKEAKKIEDTKSRISFMLSEENKAFFDKLVYTNIVRGNLKYSFTKGFLEGLELLQQEHQNIPERIDKNRRYNRVKQAGSNLVAYKTSIFSKQSDIEWIENYTCFKIGSNPSYTRTLFIDEIVQLLSKKYLNNLLEIPKEEI